MYSSNNYNLSIYGFMGRGDIVVDQYCLYTIEIYFSDTISIEHTVASLFQLRAYSDVTVNIVSSESVMLDFVELTFRDLYLGRSEMWRLKNAMINTCVYNNKKLDFCGGYTRVQVHEIWSKGKIVSCGVVSDNTKVFIIIYYFC